MPNVEILQVATLVNVILAILEMGYSVVQLIINCAEAQIAGKMKSVGKTSVFVNMVTKEMRELIFASVKVSFGDSQ